MLSERLYRLLLVAYPRDHRRAYGELMVQLFRDRMYRDGGGFGSLSVWLEMIIDLGGSALKEHSNGGSMTTRFWVGTTAVGPIVICAALLFLGFPILSEAIAWLSPVSFHITVDQGQPVLLESPNGFFVVAVAILAVSYALVRRLDHQMLPQLWLYAITWGAIDIFSSLAFNHLADTHTWLAIAEAARLIAVVWFARKVSVISFRHSLLLIGLTAAIQGPFSLFPSQLLTRPSQFRRTVTSLYWSVERY